MNISTWLSSPSVLWSPWTVAALIGVAVILIWGAFAPAQPAAKVRNRLDGYLDRGDVIEEADLSQPFVVRVFMPLVRRILRLLGGLMPKRGVEATELLLRQAGQPGGLSALDFFGLRLLCVLIAAGIYFLVARGSLPFQTLLRNCLLVGLVGFMIPWLWLRSRANRRKNDISRALPDVLDMLTISVEAGLAFESALLRVGDRWQNALTRELRRAVAEIRIGTPRDEALQRMADRTGVPDLRAFVAVLIQSGQLGVSIAQILHGQAAEMRIRRRQRAEELARQASVKMVFPLVFLIFPALFFVILGPSIPQIVSLLGRLAGGG
jgi:tight adherence protein C